MVGSNPDAQPTTILIANLAGDFGRNEHILPAAAFVQAFVPLVVFFATPAVLRPRHARRLGQGLTAGRQRVAEGLWFGDSTSR